LLLSLYPAIVGVIGGIISTAAMTLTEIPSWKKWGLHGVFEWHENQVITTHLVHLPDAKRKGENHFEGIFFLHFLNGILAGMAFPYIISFLVHSTNLFSSSLFGISYGIVLWILTLAPIHKPITGFSLWNHPLGHLPALASLSGHIVYGIVLGLIVAFIKQ
jgi:hypothetical protein